jgi:hypothetical protein
MKTRAKLSGGILKLFAFFALESEQAGRLGRLPRRSTLPYAQECAYKRL